MLMGNTRAGWCLTTDNRLERRRGHVGVNANHLGEVKLGGCMRVWRESEVEQRSGGMCKVWLVAH